MLTDTSEKRMVPMGYVNGALGHIFMEEKCAGHSDPHDHYRCAHVKTLDLWKVAQIKKRLVKGAFNRLLRLMPLLLLSRFFLVIHLGANPYSKGWQYSSMQ